MKPIVTQIIAAALVVMGFVSFANAAGIGKVLVSVGQVEAVASDGVKRDLKRRSAIFATDTVATFSGSKTQLRFTDGSMVSLAENSLFKIEEYQFGGDGEKAVYSLLKGGLQTITGAIGHTTKQDYTLKTPVATIGIRGTFYQVFVTADGGLVGFVKEGGIVVENSNGDTVSIQPGEYFSMDSATGDVIITDAPPEAFKKAEEENASEEKEDEVKKGDGKAKESDGETVELEDGTVTITEESDDSAGVDTNPGSYDPVAGGSVVAGPARIDLPIVGTKAPAGAGFGIAFIGDEASADSYVVDALRQLYVNASKAITYVDVEDGNCYVCQFAKGSAVAVNTGSAAIGVNWGRWAGGFVVAENGVEQTVVGPEFHYIYSENLTSYSDLKEFGGSSASFELGGATSPTSSNGVDYDLAVFDMNVNFSMMEITAVNIQITDIEEAVIVSGSLLNNTAVPISQSLTTGLILNNGKANVQFLGQNPAVSVGVAATYQLQDGNGPSVVGAAFLNQCEECGGKRDLENIDFGGEGQGGFGPPPPPGLGGEP